MQTVVDKWNRKNNMRFKAENAKEDTKQKKNHAHTQRIIKNSKGYSIYVMLFSMNFERRIAFKYVHSCQCDELNTVQQQQRIFKSKHTQTLYTG